MWQMEKLGIKSQLNSLIQRSISEQTAGRPHKCLFWTKQHKIQVMDKSKQKKVSVLISKPLRTGKADNVPGRTQDMVSRNSAHFPTPSGISEGILEKSPTWIHPQLTLDVKKRMMPKFRTVSTLGPFPYSRGQFRHQVNQDVHLVQKPYLLSDGTSTVLHASIPSSGHWDGITDSLPRPWESDYY